MFKLGVPGPLQTSVCERIACEERVDLTGLLDLLVLDIKLYFDN